LRPVIREQVKNRVKRIRIHIGLMLAGGLLLVACARQERPKGVLSEKKMVQLMMEIYITEEKASRIPVPYDSMTKLFPYFREELLKRSGVTDSIFKLSWNYYMADPKKMEYLYTAVIDSLNLREQAFPDGSKKDNAAPE
jgi:hypothetical protein